MVLAVRTDHRIEHHVEHHVEHRVERRIETDRVANTPGADAHARVPRFALAFRSFGTTYLELADLVAGDDVVDAEAMPRHGELVHHDGGDHRALIADVAYADVPLAYRSWLGVGVMIDRACMATVVGFAVVARVEGKADYAGIPEDAWTPATILRKGAPVLAARLVGCESGGRLAVVPSSPAIVELPFADDDRAWRVAKANVLASPDARAATADWAKHGRSGTWQEQIQTDWSGNVYRHPGTGELFVSVQARYRGECGDPVINLWHLYKVDAAGALTRLDTKLGEIDRIDRLLDIDGDGTPEVLGTAHWQEDVYLQSLSGAVVSHLADPKFGCPC